MHIGISIGAKLLHIRDSKNLTQQDVQDSTGIKREYLVRIEHPERESGFQNLTIKTIKKLLDCYGYSFARFFREINQ